MPSASLTGVVVDGSDASNVFGATIDSGGMVLTTTVSTALTPGKVKATIKDSTGNEATLVTQV